MESMAKAEPLFMARSPPPTPPSSPPTPSSRGTRIYYCYYYSNKALDDYNNHHQNKFELVVPLCFKTLYADEPHQSDVHLGFIAKSLSSKEHKLFFADFSKDGKLITCTIVEPGNPFFEYGCFHCHSTGPICHPFIGYQASHGSAWETHACGYHRLDPYEESSIRLLRDAYTITSGIQKLHTEEVDELKKTIDGYVLNALNKYNRENNSSCKHLETIFCVRFRRYSKVGMFWAHVIFKVKDKDSTPVHLFAELCLDSRFITCVAMCSTDYASSLSGDETRSEWLPRCCPIVHPVGNYVDCKRGILADSMWDGHCYSVKSELQEKAGEASHFAWLEHSETMQSSPLSFATTLGSPYSSGILERSETMQRIISLQNTSHDSSGVLNRSQTMQSTSYPWQVKSQDWYWS